MVAQATAALLSMAIGSLLTADSWLCGCYNAILSTVSSRSRAVITVIKFRASIFAKCLISTAYRAEHPPGRLLSSTPLQERKTPVGL